MLIKKRLVSLTRNLGMFLQSQNIETMSQNWPRLYLVQAAKLGNVRVNQVVLILNSMKMLS